MSISEAQAKASEKYRKSTLVRVEIKLNRNTQSGLVEWFLSKENKQGYILELIRKDMESNMRGE